jgi:light-regulated signal transduction histidine kinase (bacteriophytochrome)
MSAFDRAMVTGVLWLTFLLVSRHAQAVTALAYQARALEKTKRELERSNAELNSFASVVAHDIRGPLNTIGLFRASPGRSWFDKIRCGVCRAHREDSKRITVAEQLG